MMMMMMMMKQDKFVEFTKGYFRETCKSQNTNPTSPTPKFPLDIIQIITRPVNLTLELRTEYSLSWCSIPLNLIFNLTTFRKK